MALGHPNRYMKKTLLITFSPVHPTSKHSTVWKTSHVPWNTDFILPFCSEYSLLGPPKHWDFASCQVGRFSSYKWMIDISVPIFNKLTQQCLWCIRVWMCIPRYYTIPCDWSFLPLLKRYSKEYWLLWYHCLADDEFINNFPSFEISFMLHSNFKLCFFHSRYSRPRCLFQRSQARSPGIVHAFKSFFFFFLFRVEQKFIYFYKILLATERKGRAPELRNPFNWNDKCNRCVPESSLWQGHMLPLVPVCRRKFLCETFP